MSRLLARVMVAALVSALGAGPAVASHWPFAGGDASRSGTQGADAGAAPVALVWSKGDPNVVTPIVITGGAGPGVQRVAYGTADGTVHLRLLSNGARVGPDGGNLVDGPITTNDPTFGAGDASVGFADSSTEERLGQLFVVHNDNTQVRVERIDLASGALDPEEFLVPATLGCEISSSPLLTPPNDTGGRVLFFTIHGIPPGTCAANDSLVRIPIEGDALDPKAKLGQVTYAPVSDTSLPITATASPTLVVLTDPASGRPRYFVGVARRNGLLFFPADTPFALDNPAPVAVPPTITAQVDTGEDPQTIVAPATAAGRVAGGEGSGTSRAPALYVATSVGGTETRVYRFVQDGAATVLRAAPAPARLPDGSGHPAPSLAVSEIVRSTGADPGGRLAVGTAANLYTLSTMNLSSIGRPLSNAPLGAGDGFGRTVPALSGSLLFTQRDGSNERAPQHLVRALDDPQASAAFEPAPGNAAGAAYGQPGLSRGFAVYGSPAGVFAYRSRDVTAPEVELLSPPASTPQRGTVAVAARAGDARGIEAVTFRVRSAKGAVRVIGVASSPESGNAWESEEGARFGIPLQTASLANGDYELEAMATDIAGLVSTARRRLRIDNGRNVVPVGACAVTRTGTRKADKLTGTVRGDRLLGGRGADLLRGGPGDDCLLGEQGNDRLDGGPGADLLDGGPGSDRIKGGAGNDRVEARDKRRDSIACGAGIDQVTADRKDRVARDCERVKRR